MDSPLGEAIGIAVCLVLSAFFSSVETALTSLSASKTDYLIDRNQTWGRALRLWQTNHASVLTTVLIGNTFVNIVASALATELATRYLPGTGLPLAIGALTFVMLMLGEITPKTLARAYSDRVALALMPPLALVHFAIYPITWVITRFIRFSISTFGGQVRPNTPVTEADIEYIITLGQREGTLDAAKQRMLTSIFEFTDTTAREIMVPRTDVVAIAVDTPYEEVVHICTESGFSRIPVYDDSIDKVLGIFFAKHLITPPKPEEREGFLRARMRPAEFVPETKKISELLTQFQHERVHMAIVVNEFGGTEGIVTLEDVIEELLGEIRDEFDEDERLLVPQPGGAFLADARIDLDDLEMALQIDFPEKETRDYESLGGFMMAAAGEVPEAGWAHEYKGYRFIIVHADVNRVNKVRVEPVSPPRGEKPAPQVERRSAKPPEPAA